MASILFCKNASTINRTRPGKGEIADGGIRALPIDITSVEYSNAVVVHISDALISDLDPYVEPWQPTLVVSEVSADLTADTHRYSLRHDVISSSDQSVNFGKLDRAVIEPLLSGWNASIVSDVDGVIEFDIALFQLMQGVNVFSYPPGVLAACTFDEINYDPTAGLHTVRINYAASGIGSTVLEQLAGQRSIIQSHTIGELVVIVPRAPALAAFIAALEQRYAAISLIYARRYYFLEAQFDTIIAGGTEPTMTLAEFQAVMTDRLA